MKKIAWIDEELNATYPYQLRFRTKGCEVTPIEDATTAYRHLLSLDGAPYDLLIVDVMLTRGNDDKFNRNRTQNGILTGLVLIEEIFKTKLLNIYTNKIIIYSRATRNDIVVEVKSFSLLNNVAYIPRTRSTNVDEFVDKVQELMGWNLV